jgi:uncharacterized membrane protein YkvA (DUF1232 family)
MQAKEQDFYQKLRGKIRNWLQSKAGKASRWSEYLLWAPDLFHLLCKLAADKDVPAKEKAKLAVAITYFISPIDFIPEAFLGPVAYLDDIALTGFVLNTMLNKIEPEVVRRHWAGEEDVLMVIKKIIAAADTMIGSGVWKKLKMMIS